MGCHLQYYHLTRTQPGNKTFHFVFTYKQMDRLYLNTGLQGEAEQVLFSVRGFCF